MFCELKELIIVAADRCWCFWHYFTSYT